MFFGELLEPDVGALGHEDHGGHPGLVGAEGFVFVERGLVVMAVTALPAVGAVDVLVFEADVLIADEAFASAARCAVAELIGPGGMEAHPDGEVFFAKDIDGKKDAAEVVAEVLGPVLSDVVELAGERVRRGKQGGGESDEVVGEGGGDGLIDRLLLEGSVFEELAEGGEGWVDVGEPQEKEFFESSFAIRLTVS